MLRQSLCIGSGFLHSDSQSSVQTISPNETREVHCIRHRIDLAKGTLVYVKKPTAVIVGREKTLTLLDFMNFVDLKMNNRDRNVGTHHQKIKATSSAASSRRLKVVSEIDS
jgi:hypothetical protein